jgi:hypothetical protein
MKIQIHPIGIKAEIVDLENVGPCYPDDDIIYFDGAPYVLHTAQPVIEVTNEQIDQLLKSVNEVACDQDYTTLGLPVYSSDPLVINKYRQAVRSWLAALTQPPTPNP